MARVTLDVLGGGHGHGWRSRLLVPKRKTSDGAREEELNGQWWAAGRSGDPCDVCLSKRKKVLGSQDTGCGFMVGSQTSILVVAGADALRGARSREDASIGTACHTPEVVVRAETRLADLHVGLVEHGCCTVVIALWPT